MRCNMCGLRFTSDASGICSTCRNERGTNKKNKWTTQMKRNNIKRFKELWVVRNECD